MLFRTLVATALVVTFGVTGALAAGRSKDERASWWQTFHQSKSMMQVHRERQTGTTQPQGTAPTGQAPAAAKPTQ